MSEEIILEFLEDGQIKMEGKGFQGKSCDEAMAVFEQALGVAMDRKNKPEYFRAEVRGNARQRA